MVAIYVFSNFAKTNTKAAKTSTRKRKKCEATPQPRSCVELAFQQHLITPG